MSSESSWTEATLGDLIEIRHGWAFKGAHFCDPEPDLPIVVKPGNFREEGGLSVEYGRTQAYNGPYPPDYELSPGDLLVVMTCQTQGGEILGVPAVIPDDGRTYLHNQRLGKVTVRSPAELDERFLYWLLADWGVRRQLVKTATGSTVLHTSPTRIGECRVRIPSPPVQRVVAGLLDAITDKIESNQALAHLLHAIAEQAYRRALASPATALLGDLGTIRGGGTPKSSVPAFWDPPEVAWITPKDMTALAGSPVIWRGERNISQLGLQKSSARLLPTGTVLYTSRATLGMIAIAQQELSTNQGFITIEPAPGLSSELVYFTLRANRDAIAAKANGSTFLEVNKTNFKAVECRIPDEGARAAFQAVAGPAFRLIAGLTQEAQRLRAVRDVLLPKLVSGQIRVPAGVEPRGEAQAADLVESTA